eukprot:scaffold390672_cov156-Cyclotella_meneghiniana.AAC.1
MASKRARYPTRKHNSHLRVGGVKCSKCSETIPLQSKYVKLLPTLRMSSLSRVCDHVTRAEHREGLIFCAVVLVLSNRTSL